jgi:hypothetical protein
MYSQIRSHGECAAANPVRLTPNSPIDLLATKVRGILRILHMPNVKDRDTSGLTGVEVLLRQAVMYQGPRLLAQCSPLRPSAATVEGTSVL